MLKVLLTSFYNSTDRITTPKWLPNDQDTLQARLWSRGITEISFNIGPITWEMTKIGKYEAGLRRKGLLLFEDVHCVLYVVPLSDYDQLLIEDDSMVCSNCSDPAYFASLALFAYFGIDHDARDNTGLRVIDLLQPMVQGQASRYSLEQSRYIQGETCWFTAL